MPFEVSNFCKTTTLDYGTGRQSVREIVYAPEPDDSEAEDLADSDNDEVTQIEQEKGLLEDVLGDNAGLSEGSGSDQGSDKSDDYNDDYVQESDDKKSRNNPPQR